MITTIPNGVKFQKGAGLSGYVAEINAAFCCASLGIVPTVRHADYIGSWLEVLREQSRHRARGKRRIKAADFLLAFRPQAIDQCRGQ
jgi:antirestriction protein ArdC